MASLWFPDTTVLRNFGEIDRLDLLRDDLKSRGRWTAAIAYEVGCQVKAVPAFDTLLSENWLGEPIETNDSDAIGVERLRIAVFGGTSHDTKKHLGEAETCYVIQNRKDFTESIWLTDDRDAYDYAKRQHLITWSTRTIIERLIADGSLTINEGFTILEDMTKLGRQVLNMPNRAEDLARSPRKSPLSRRPGH